MRLNEKILLLMRDWVFFLSLFILRERERERERESQAGSSLPAQSPMWGSDPQSHEIVT